MIMESRFRAAAREILNGLKNATDTQSTVKWLNTVNCLVTKGENSRLPAALQSYEDVPFAELCSVFRERHFSSVCCAILDLLTVEWVQALPARCFTENVESLFLYGPAADSLMTLDRAIQENSQGFRLQKITTLLETFITKGRLLQVMLDQCSPLNTAEGQCVQRALSCPGGLWDGLVTTMTALPTRMANRLGRETSEVFLPQWYIPRVAQCMVQCLHRAHHLHVKAGGCSLNFVARLLGKLCFTGHADPLLDVMVPVMCTSVSTDPTWSDVVQTMLMAVPLTNMESVVVPLLAKVPWYQWLDKLLGDCVIHNQRVKFLLCNKLLFHCYFSQELLLQNLIGYLSSSPARRHLYKEVFENLLGVWSDASHLRHVSSEQHLFLCRAIMVCLSHLTSELEESWRHDLLQLLLPGVQNHLGSSDVSIRCRGMLVAKCLTRQLDPNGQPIDFEIPPSPETEALEKLLIVPPDPGLAPIERAMEKIHLPDPQPQPPPLPSTDNADELDSDDDLVPYDMTFDTKEAKVKAPKYIRDCMEGLLDTEQVDQFEVSLQAAENLIWTRPDGLTEISAEFSKILLHTTESCAIQDFVGLRFKAMVALAVQCPQQVAPYLTSQFYERNYNIRQRLDILEVLTAAAQKLSQPEKPATKTSDKRSAQPEEIHCSQPESWRDIVQRRIDSKTRRFGKGRTQPEPVATANRFGDVAGEFFYPLMTLYDRGEGFLDLLGNDSLILSRLVYSLAVILHCAVNTTASRQMGRSLLEFTWSLRMHRDVTVRQAVLVSTSIIILVLPPHFLLNDLQVDAMETKAWLEEAADKEVNTDCRELAVQGLRLLEATIAKEMQDAVAAHS